MIGKVDVEHRLVAVVFHRTRNAATVRGFVIKLDGDMTPKTEEDEIPSRELTYPTLGNHLQNAILGGYVSPLEGIRMVTDQIHSANIESSMLRRNQIMFKVPKLKTDLNSINMQLHTVPKATAT